MKDSTYQLMRQDYRSKYIMTVHIKENSWLAKIAAKKLRSQSVAMVVGRTIHLSNATKEAFLKDEKWLRHELVHVQQYHHYGTLRFLFLYLYESIIKGYHNNKFEVEAREKENDASIPQQFIIR